MSLITFGAAKTSRISRIAGNCVDGDEFKRLVNDATRMLMNRGNWWGTVVKAQVCSYNGCMVWPRWVGTVLAANVCNTALPIFNHWYQFIPMEGCDYNTNRVWHSNVAMVQSDVTPVYNNVPCGSENYIRFFPRNQSDVGKVVIVYGLDYNGQPVRTLHADGTVQDGEEVTLALPFASTTTTYRLVTRIQKPVTDYILDVFQYDAGADIMLNMATYEPYETDPQYRQTNIQGWSPNGCCATNCNGLRKITVLAKMEFIPVEGDNDLIQIENLDALSLAIQSVKLSDAYDNDGAEKLMARAVHEMNLQLRDKLPLEQFPVVVRAFGTATPANHGIGRMI